MSETYNKADESIVVETETKVAKDFETADLSVPADFKQPKPSKTDLKLIHVAVDHIFMNVISNLKQSQSELESIVEKKGDERAEMALNYVGSLIKISNKLIDDLAEQVDALPNVEEIEALLKKLYKEQLLAQALLLTEDDVALLTEDVPKEKMH